MDLHDLGRFIGAALVPLFWIFALSTALWLVRKLAPQWERVLFDPVTVVAARAYHRLRANLHIR